MTTGAREPRLRADARRNRDRVLVAAERVFMERGLAAPLTDIARAANVGVGTIYRRYPTKDHLVAAIVGRRIEASAEIVEGLGYCGDPAAAFSALMDHLIEAGMAKKVFLDAVYAADGDLASILAAPRARLNEAITRILERAQDACAVRADVTAADIVALLAASFRAAESIDRPPRVLFEILRTGLERRA